MAAGKGYGSPMGNGKGRGVFSEKKNMAPVPKKGSELNMSSPLQREDAAKVKKMAAMQMKEENLRGKPS